jgi:hypothetical protein
MKQNNQGRRVKKFYARIKKEAKLLLSDMTT